jgi:hypothetical protein
MFAPLYTRGFDSIGEAQGAQHKGTGVKWLDTGQDLETCFPYVNQSGL